jgi:hypothetical protein
MTLEIFKAALTALTSDELKAFLERRHPTYADKLEHWNFLEATYEGGREWFNDNIFRYVKEGDEEFDHRVARAYRFNHTREIVDLVNKYIFKAQINRREADAPLEIREFWKASTLRRQEITEFMKMISSRSSIYGRVWGVVDSTKDYNGGTALEDKLSDSRVYCYIVRPQDFLDASFTKDGELNWCLIRESKRDDDDFWSSGTSSVRYRLWTKNYWALFKEFKRADGSKAYEYSDAGEHGLDVVPVFPVNHVTDEELYTGQALIDDTAYLDRAVANYLSNLDAIIQDQTFSQLVIPAQAMMPGEDGHEKLLEMGTKRIFTYDGQANIPPSFISPDAKQTEIILKVIQRIIGEIYHSTGMAGERTKQDNAAGIDNSSGVAKAYDFERMNAMLASKANALQQAENRLMDIVMRYHTKTLPTPERPLVEYPKNFDVRSLYDEFEIAQNLALVNAPKMVRREQMKVTAAKMFPVIGDAELEKMLVEIDKEWLEQPDLGPAGASNIPPSRVPNPVEENRQGQVTDD